MSPSPLACIYKDKLARERFNGKELFPLFQNDTGMRKESA